MTSNAARMLTVRSALAYLALLAGVAFFVPNAGILGAAAVILAIILGWRDLRRVSRIIFSLLIAAFVAAIFIEPTALLTAANNMTRLTTLIISVMLLSSMLGHSKDLDTISRSLFAGKPLARYYSIAFGTAFLSVPLNFGSVGVVATMIRGEITRRGDTAMTQNASRGALRGFGASPISSPLSISIVLTVTLLPGLHSWQLIAVSFPVAVLYLLSGALFRTPEPALARPDDFKPSGPMPWLRFAGIIGAICISTMLLSTLAGLSYSRAVAFSCLGAVAVGLVMRRLEGSKISLPNMAPVTNELVIVGGSAFLGALISAFALQLMGEDFTLHGWAYPATAFCVPFVFYLGGMVGLNPIVIGTLTGGVLAPIWPSEALLGLGVGMVSGWGITTAGTPHTANSLLLERITGYSAHLAAIRWNLVLSLTSLTCTGLLAAGLTAGLRML